MWAVGPAWVLPQRDPVARVPAQEAPSGSGTCCAPGGGSVQGAPWRWQNSRRVGCERGVSGAGQIPCASPGQSLQTPGVRGA